MEKLINGLALLSLLVSSALFTGCDDDEDNGGGNQVNAPVNIQGQEITLTPAGGQAQRYTFTAQGNTAHNCSPSASRSSNSTNFSEPPTTRRSDRAI